MADNGGSDLIRLASDFLAGSGNPTSAMYTAYSSFWETMRKSPTFAASYIVCLIGRLLPMETGEAETVSLEEAVTRLGGLYEWVDIPKKPALSNRDLVMRESILVTISYIHTFFNVDRSLPVYQRAVAQWEAYRGRGFDFQDQVVSDLSANPVELDKRVMNLVIDAVQIQQMGMQQSTVPNVATLLGGQSLASALTPLHLQALLEADESASELLYFYAMLLLSHQGSNDTQVLAILALLDLYISVSHRMALYSKLRALQLTRSLSLWPEPFGTSALAAFDVFTTELLAPGAGQRRFAREVLLEDDVYIRIGTTELDGRFRELLKSSATGSQAAQVKQMKVDIVAGLVRTVVGEEVSSLSVGDDFVDELFEGVCAAMDEAACMDDLDRAHEAAAAQIQTLVDQLTGGGGREYQINRVPVAPDVNFSFMQGNTRCNMDVGVYEGPDGGAAVYEFPNVMAIEALRRTLLQRRERLDDDIRAGKGAAAGEAAWGGDGGDGSGFSVPLKLVVIGDDTSFSSIVVAVTVLRTTEPELLEGLDVQLHFAPLDGGPASDDLLAAYLSSRDGWWRKNVLQLATCALKVLPFVPRKQLDEGEAVDDWDLSFFLNAGGPPSGGGEPVEPVLSPPTPGDLLRFCVQNYVRRARCRVDLCVFVCEVWCQGKKKRDDPIHRTVPFMASVEVGVGAYTKMFRRTKQVDHLDDDEVQNVKGFKHKPVEVGVFFSEMSVGGQLLQPTSYESMQFESIVVSNIARQSMSFSDADPSAESVELYISELDSRKARRKAGGRVTRLANCVSVEVLAKDVKKPFPVIIDRNLFEGCVKIKITPFRDADDNQHRVTLKTFLPFYHE